MAVGLFCYLQTVLALRGSTVTEMPLPIVRRAVLPRPDALMGEGVRAPAPILPASTRTRGLTIARPIGYPRQGK
jgi:hypothetical protein